MQVLGWTDSQFLWATQVERERWNDYLHAVNTSREWLWVSLNAAVDLLDLFLCMEVLLGDPNSLRVMFWTDIVTRYSEGTLEGMEGQQHSA